MAIVRQTLSLLVVAVILIAAFAGGYYYNKSEVESKSDAQTSAPTHERNDFSDGGADSSFIPMSEDAYHYNGELTWIEWWYFNLVDDTDDLQIFIMYIIMHVGSYFFGIPVIEVGLYNKGEMYEARDMYTMFDFATSKEQPFVKVGDCTMNAADSDNYFIQGDTRDKHVVWDLHYERTIQPFDPPEKANEMNYLVYMPGARVVGTVIIGGAVYNVTGGGYHDHDWGAPPFSTVYYKWAILYEPQDDDGLIFERIEFDGTTLLAMFNDSETIVFDAPVVAYSEYQIESRSSILVSGIEIPTLSVYPKKWHISASNGEYSLSLDITVLKNLPLYMGGVPLLSPYLINEQISAFSGELRKNGDIVHTFNSLGFTEYIQ